MLKSIIDNRIETLNQLKSERSYLASLHSTDEDILDEINRYDEVIDNMEYEIGISDLIGSLI